MHGYQRLWRRRRRAVLASCLALCLFTSMFTLSDRLFGYYMLDVPNDYDLNYERQKSSSSSGVAPTKPMPYRFLSKSRGRLQYPAVEPREGTNLNFESAKIHLDRKPQSHNPEEDEDNNGVVRQRQEHSPTGRASSVQQAQSAVIAGKLVGPVNVENNHPNDDNDDDYDDHSPHGKPKGLFLEIDDDDDDDYDDDEDYENPPFKAGDFDYNKNNATKPTVKSDFVTSGNRSGDGRSRLSPAVKGSQRKPRTPQPNNKGGGVNPQNNRSEHQVISSQRFQNFRNIKNSNQYTDEKEFQPNHGRRKIHDDDDGLRDSGVLLIKTSVISGIGAHDGGGGGGGGGREEEEDAIVVVRGQDKIETQIPLQDGVSASAMSSQPATQIHMPRLKWNPGEVRSQSGMPLVVDRIFWSKEVEDLVPSGASDKDFQHFLYKVQTGSVESMEPPLWNRCGRPLNQYIVLRDGTQLCARYRAQYVKLVHGEVLSYYLSRILGLDNVPMVALSRVNTSTPQWQSQKLEPAEWSEGIIVALIQWVNGLDSERSRVKMPPVMLEAYESGTVFDWKTPSISNLTANDLSDLLQWSDMILFDYLTAHYDRVASMQDGADREQKPTIMHENIRNLRKVWQMGKLWLIDNESGLLDAFELLYLGKEMGHKFVRFHQQILHTNCVFRKRTAEKLLQLSSISRPEEILLEYAAAQDPLYRHLPTTLTLMLFKQHFHTRLKEVAEWIRYCQRR